MNHRYRVFFYDLLFIILVAVFSFFVGCFVGAYIDRNRYKGLNINAQSKEESEQIQKEEKYIPPLYVQAIQGTIIDPFFIKSYCYCGIRRVRFCYWRWRTVTWKISTLFCIPQSASTEVW